MKKLLLVFCAAAMVTHMANGQKCGPYDFPSYSVYDTAAAKSWGGVAFQLSDAYPAAQPAAPAGGYPWEKVDFRKKSSEYLNTVLNYCWEGMDDAKWVAQDNKVRTWYHAPWLHEGYGGREFIHGLVMDRTVEANALSPKQTEAVRSYSITYYNAEAAYALGQVWCDTKKPDPAKAKFPVGSVIMKMYFTPADTSMVPHLLGAMEWEAFVEKSIGMSGNKESAPVRLAQIDLSVRTANKEAATGWVHGVMLYDGRKSGDNVKSKFVTLGAQWGADPGLKPADVEGGKPLTQTWVNTNVWNQKDPAKGLVQKLGYGHRLQGPFGNGASSMLSERIASTWPITHLVPPMGTQPDSILKWHRNLAPGEAFAPGLVSLDQSLELRTGLLNHAVYVGNDSLLRVKLDDEVANMLGFVPLGRDLGLPEFEEKDTVPADEGLTGRNLWVFIGFAALMVTFLGLLVWNFLRDKKEA